MTIWQCPFRPAGSLGVPARPVRLFLAALLLWLVAAIPAFAHASLVSTEPVDGVVLAAAPEELSLTFSEPVAPLRLELIAPDGTRIALDGAELRDRTLAVASPAGLGRGTHVLSWRIVSEDGHPVSGSVLFSIVEPSVVAADRPAASPSVSAAVWSGKLLLYVGLFLGLGGVFAMCWFAGARDGHLFVVACIAAGLAGVVVSAGAQGLDALGLPPSSIGDPQAWKAGLDTSFGRTVFAALAALLAGLAALLSTGAAARALSLLGLLLSGVALSASGHAAAADPRWLTRPAAFMHAVTIACWTGALVPLALAMRRDTVGATAALARFSAAIPWLLAMLVFAGLALAVIQVGEPPALIATAYGRLLLVKLALVALILALAAFNRFRLTAPAQAGERRIRGRLAGSIAVETLLVVLVFGVAAGWRFTPPPRALAVAAAAPASIHLHGEKAMADLVFQPGRAGPVSVSITLQAGDFGALDAKEVTLVVANEAAGIAAVRRGAVKGEAGAWRVDDLVLPLPGRWSVRVDILITDFEMTRLTGEVGITR